MKLQSRLSVGLFGLVSVAALCAAASPASAAEGYRLRQPSFPLLGAEMGGDAIEKVGFFGTAAASYIHTYDVAGDDGETIQSPGQVIPLATGAPTGGLIPDGTYSAAVQPGQIDFDQTSQQYNLIIGYLIDPGIKGARIGVSLNQIYQSSSREVTLGPQAVSLTPAAPASLPPPLAAALNGAVSTVAAQVELRQAAELAVQNQDVSGFGDTTVAVLYTQVAQEGRLRFAGAVSYAMPNGDYEASRGPNPGFNYATTRIETALAYSFPDQHQHLSEVTVGVRGVYGWNGANEATDYETGDFYNLEVAVQKNLGDFAFGVGAFALAQTTDDRASGVVVDGARYEAYGGGPFVAYRFPGRNLGVNLSYSDTFGVRNGQVSRGVSLRLIRTW